MQLFTEALSSGFYTAATYALAAFGLAIVYGVLHILNFAHGVMLLGGAYLAVDFTGRGMPFWLALLLSMLVIAAIGGVLELTLFRRVEGSHIAGLLVSIGLIGIADSVFLQVFGPDPQRLDRLIDGSFKTVSGAVIPKDRMFIVMIAAVTLTVAQLAIAKTMWGKSLRATAENADVAGLQGIRVSRIKFLTFSAGAGLAAFAGVIIGTAQPIEPVMAESLLIKAFIVIILGGVGSTIGTIVGALFLGIAESLGIIYFPTIVAQLLPLILLCLVLYFRPQGLLGQRMERA